MRRTFHTGALLLLLGAGDGCMPPPPDCGDGAQCENMCTVVRCPSGQTCDEMSGTCVEPPPPVPVITGALIDRAGRPGISTLLLNPFDLFKPQDAAAVEDGDVTRDRYNADGSPAQWVARWRPAMSFHMALLDGLDGTCGDSLAADAVLPRYSVVAGILADDQLYVDVSTSTCADVYFAVERKAIGEMVKDCGGRTLRADVIDTTLSELASGKAEGMSDGVGFEAKVVSSFPFFGNPVK